MAIDLHSCIGHKEGWWKDAGEQVPHPASAFDACLAAVTRRLRPVATGRVHKAAHAPDACLATATVRLRLRLRLHPVASGRASQCSRPYLLYKRGGSKVIGITMQSPKFKPFMEALRILQFHKLEYFTLVDVKCNAILKEILLSTVCSSGLHAHVFVDVHCPCPLLKCSSHSHVDMWQLWAGLSIICSWSYAHVRYLLS